MSNGVFIDEPVYDTWLIFQFLAPIGGLMALLVISAGIAALWDKRRRRP